MSFKNNTYQGWKNYFTWNAALHIDNEYYEYLCAREFMRTYKGRAPYVDFIKSYGLIKTIDGISFLDKRISRTEMNQYMRNLNN